MKTLSAGALAHVAQETTTLSTCWKITRRDGQVFGFTDSDIALTVDGQVYTPTSGYTRSAISTNSTLAVDNLDVEAVLADDAITEADLLAGLWDFAEVRMFSVNRADTSQVIKLRRGWMGEVMVKDSGFVCELRGLAQVLQSTVGELYSASCRADLGDARCGVNLAALTAAGTATAVASARQFTDTSLTAGSGYYDGGLVTWTSGLNAGLEMEVKTYAASVIELQQPMPYAIEVGDAYTVSPGCDKSLATCRDVFSNVVNFRGEPHIPGSDQILKGPA